MQPRRDPRTYAIIGAAMKVHGELGPGHLESVYQKALAIQFEESNIPSQCEVPLEVLYHGRPAGIFRADFLCHGAIIVELKATGVTTNSDIAQVANYLAATRHPLGLLLNFGTTSLDFRRIIGRHAEPKRHRNDD